MFIAFDHPYVCCFEADIYNEMTLVNFSISKKNH